jgi:hypothetical protein
MNKMLSTLTTLIVAAVAVSFNAVHADDHKPGDEAHAGHMLEGYIAVTDALFKDDFAKAKEAALGIAKYDPASALAAPATKLAQAKDIAAAREAFKKLSAAAIEIARVHGGGKYTVMNCPMVDDGAGDWLSADGKVNNPYFGPAMPHCGGPKKK